MPQGLVAGKEDAAVVWLTGCDDDDDDDDDATFWRLFFTELKRPSFFVCLS